jgi:Tfp pilus assembly protein PilE
MTVADEIAKLADLKNKGALTEDEFEAQKKNLLAQGAAQGTPVSPGQVAQAPLGPQPVKSKISVLAVLAFVFSFFLGPLAAILAIIAIVVIATSRGKLRGMGLAIGAICVSLFFWGILAATAIPAFTNYMRRAKTSEATLNIDRIFEGAVNYYEAEHVGPGGQILTNQLPANTEWTPSVSCCEQTGEKCSAAENYNAWDTPTWRSLDFSMGDNFYYQYRFMVDGNMFYCQAQGDLDCDGTYSLLERAGAITDEGYIQASSGIYKRDPLE